MTTRNIAGIRRLLTCTLLILVVLAMVPLRSTYATLPDPFDYFSYSYTITFNQKYISEGEVFYAQVEGNAICTKDAPVHPTEATIKGRVVGRHIASGTRFALNSSYVVLISPVPSKKGEVITATQEVSLYFPPGSPDGEYQITAELIEAKIKIGGLWVDITSAFPQEQDMGKAFYNVTKPTTVEPTTTIPPTTTTPVDPGMPTTQLPTSSAPKTTTTATTATTTPPPTTTSSTKPSQPTTTTAPVDPTKPTTTPPTAEPSKSTQPATTTAPVDPGMPTTQSPTSSAPKTTTTPTTNSATSSLPADTNGNISNWALIIYTINGALFVLAAILALSLWRRNR